MWIQKKKTAFDTPLNIYLYMHTWCSVHILLHMLKYACSCLPTFTCIHSFIVNYLIVAGFMYLEVSHKLVSSQDYVPACPVWYIWIKSSLELVLHKVPLWWIWIWNISTNLPSFSDIDYFRQRPDFFFSHECLPLVNTEIQPFLLVIFFLSTTFTNTWMRV